MPERQNETDAASLGMAEGTATLVVSLLLGGLIEEEVQLPKERHPTDEGYLSTAEGVAMFVVSLLLG